MACQAPVADRKLKVVVVGAHVDDPQPGCGGTIARYADLDHDVVALSLTRGDSESIAASLHLPPQELAAKRYAYAQRSCDLLRCRFVALHYINRGTDVTMARYQEFGETLLDQKPDVVFTHWPIDTHPGHRAASLLTYDAWLRGGKKFLLYFFGGRIGPADAGLLANRCSACGEVKRVHVRGGVPPSSAKPGASQRCLECWMPCCLSRLL